MKRTLLLASAIFLLSGTLTQAQAPADVVRQDHQPAAEPTSLVAEPVKATATSNTKTYESQRPAPEMRLFRSEAVENKIAQMQGILTNPRLAWTTPVNPTGQDVLIICEGIPDALTAAQAGLNLATGSFVNRLTVCAFAGTDRTIDDHINQVTTTFFRPNAIATPTFADPACKLLPLRYNGSTMEIFHQPGQQHHPAQLRPPDQPRHDRRLGLAGRHRQRRRSRRVAGPRVGAGRCVGAAGGG